MNKEQGRTINENLQIKGELLLQKESLEDKEITIISLNVKCMEANVKEVASKDLIDSLKIQLKEYANHFNTLESKFDWIYSIRSIPTTSTPAQDPQTPLPPQAMAILFHDSMCSKINSTLL